MTPVIGRARLSQVEVSIIDVLLSIQQVKRRFCPNWASLAMPLVTRRDFDLALDRIKTGFGGLKITKCLACTNTYY